MSKVVLCSRRNVFATFSEDALQFSWQAQHFGRVHRHLAWQAQHFRRVLLRAFCKSHWHGCVKWRQGADSGRRGILLDVLKIDGTPEYALLKTPKKSLILATIIEIQVLLKYFNNLIEMYFNNIIGLFQ